MAKTPFRTIKPSNIAISICHILTDAWSIKD
jgi:hypothetical protein